MVENYWLFINPFGQAGQLALITAERMCVTFGRKQLRSKCGFSIFYFRFYHSCCWHLKEDGRSSTSLVSQLVDSVLIGMGEQELHLYYVYFITHLRSSCYRKVQLLSRVQLSAIPWMAARKAPLSLGFSKQEYWSRLLCPFPEGLPDPGIEPRSPILQADSLPSEPPGNQGSPWCQSYQAIQRLGYFDQTTISICSAASSIWSIHLPFEHFQSHRF